MMLLLLAPSSPLPHPIHHLGCHLSAGQGQQDRCPRPQHRGWRAAGPGSWGTAPGEGDTMSPGRGGRAEQRPGDTDGEGQGLRGAACLLFLGAAPCSWHTPALLCMSHVSITPLCHCPTVTNPAAARHTQPTLTGGTFKNPGHEPTLRRRHKNPTPAQKGPKAGSNLLCAGWHGQQQGDTRVWGGGEPKASYTP